MKLSLVVPAIAAGWILVVGGSLQLIIGRSPYTHGNLAPRPDVAYARTEQIMVGTPVPMEGMGVPMGASMGDTTAPGMSMVQPMVGSDAITRGRVLMVTASCATCHGLDGRGGPVGPSIAGTNAKKLRAMTSTGAGGMPAFSSTALSDDDLNAIAAYLAAQASQKPTATPGGGGDAH